MVDHAHGTARVRAVGTVRAALPLAALVFVSLVTSGCATATPATTPDPSALASPSTQTPAPTSWHVPEARFAVDCDAIAPDVQTRAGAAVDAVVEGADPLVTAASAGSAIPRKTSILSLGGLVCEWSNGAPYSDQYGANPDYAGITVSVTPEPEAGWSEAMSRFGLDRDVRTCEPAALGCFLHAKTAFAVVSMEASSTAAGQVDRPAVEALFADITSAIESAGEPSPAVVASRDVPPLPGGCDGFVTLDVVRTVSGEPELTEALAGGGWSDWAEARLASGNVPCVWAMPDGGGYTASVAWVRDGRWALERASAAHNFSATTAQWLGPDDFAGIRCNDAYWGDSCAVDIARGPDWISVTTAGEDDALALAEAVMSQLGE